ncbi:cupin domain-containing protein [Paraburkholderia dipogonis]|uniref:Cupin domain-containing protein n=1 Tax=Paraburkholderia dipogonis TaxID=1211383 RepID=A0A4Y8N961_9BURK|nr:cupin domain-containing protein [Paraburkholderia dipogonis]TFE46300.1 cupin domain-containing protein [Paraburkholderia dipogonis]
MPDSHAIKDELIRRLDLKPHPEGGFFSETYRSVERVIRDKDVSGAAETRSASTAIYYLLCDGAHSAWHRIQSDEVWHFYAGEPLNVHVLDQTGALVTHKLGNALTHPDAVFQAVVPAGLWFAAECADPATFALVGCTVAPGFEFSEFELADVGTLKALYPRHVALIERLGPT